jgi:hypothetical protein
LSGATEFCPTVWLVTNGLQTIVPFQTSNFTKMAITAFDYAGTAQFIADCFSLALEKKLHAKAHGVGQIKYASTQRLILYKKMSEQYMCHYGQSVPALFPPH